MTNNQSHQAHQATSPNGPAGNPDGTDRAKSSDINAMRDDVNEIARAAGREASSLANTARHQAQRVADHQKRNAAGTIEDVAHMLRQAGSNLEDKVNLQSIVQRAAETLEDVSDSIRNKSFGDLYQDAEDFARRRPVTTALGTAALGLIIARFIKSSADRAGYERGLSHARDDSFERYEPLRYR